MVENKDILAIVTILRRVTKIVKIYPFIYAGIYALCMIGYMFLSDETADILDQLFVTSPIVVSCNLLLSKTLKLCKWHRLQCLLPIVPLLPIYVDSYIYSLSKVGAYINTTIILLLFLASLINAYFVFIKPLYNETNRS